MMTGEKTRLVSRGILEKMNAKKEL